RLQRRSGHRACLPTVTRRLSSPVAARRTPGSTMRARRLHNTRDAQARARRILPRAVSDFVDGGADDELTLRRNEEAFARVELRPRAAVHVGRPSVATTVLGEQVSLPVLLAPCGFARVVHPDGDVCAARASEALGTVSILS